MNKAECHRPKNEDELSRRMALVESAQQAATDRFLATVNTESANLIRASAARGMSRTAMNRIWGDRLVKAVLG